MALDALLQKRVGGTQGNPQFELNLRLLAEPGITVLVGPSGSGKTSTLNCLGGFIRPDSGRILLNNEILFDAAANINLPPEKRHCGYIFQDHALFPHMCVRDNLMFAARSAPGRGGRRLETRRQVNQLLDSFELTELAERMPAQLSGGEKQRAALARILVSAPRLLLLDEPTRGLDTRLRASFYLLLEQTQKRLAVPVLLITHDIEECLRVADSIYLLEDGRVLQSGTRQAVIGMPATIEVARALGIFNFLAAEIVELDPTERTSCLRVWPVGANSSGPDYTDIDGPHLPGHLLGDRGTVCFRESEVEVLPSGLASSAPAIVSKVLSASDSAGGVRLQFGEQFYGTVPQSRWDLLRHNQQVRVLIPPEALRFFD